MTVNFAKCPVRYVSTNEDILKGEYAGSHTDGTDHKQDTVAPETVMGPMYRIPMDRWNGNSIFRRYPNGQLDIDYAKHKVVDAIHTVVNGVPLNSEQAVTLSCLFPGSFGYIDASMADSALRSTLRITPFECMEVASAVADHLQKELEYKHSCHAR